MFPFDDVIMSKNRIKCRYCPCCRGDSDDDNDDDDNDDDDHCNRYYYQSTYSYFIAIFIAFLINMNIIIIWNTV